MGGLMGVFWPRITRRNRAGRRTWSGSIRGDPGARRLSFHGVAEGRVEVGAGLHLADDGLLGAGGADGGVNVEGRRSGGAARTERIEGQRDAGGAEFCEGEVRSLAELGEVCEHGDAECGGEGPVVGERGEGFGEDHVGAGGDIGLGAGEGGGEAFDARGVGAGHDDEGGIGFAGDGGAHAGGHRGRGDELFAGEVAAEFRGDLVFEVNRGGAGGGDFPDGGRGIVPTGVDVDQERERDAAGDAADVDEDVGEGGVAGVGETAGVVGDAGAGKIEGAEAGALGEEGGVGVEGAGDLERTLGGEGGAKKRTGGRRGDAHGRTVNHAGADGHQKRGGRRRVEADVRGRKGRVRDRALRLGEAAEDGAQREIKGGDDERDAEEPGGGGMDPGQAEALEEGPRVVAKRGGERRNREGHGGGAPEEFAGADVAEDEHELQRAEQLVEGLQNRLVEPQGDARPEIHQPSETEKREQRAGGADGQGEGEPVRGDALRELGAHRGHEAALPEGGARGRSGVRHGR